MSLSFDDLGYYIGTTSKTRRLLLGRGSGLGGDSEVINLMTDKHELTIDLTAVEVPFMCRST